MRIFLSCLVAAGLTASPVLAATCAQPADTKAMDITALKTQLMVTALTCNADDRYNAFILKYRPDLAQTDKALATFFTRSYGRNGAKQRDDYVTQLANSQSQTGLKQGSLYCVRTMSIFEEVMALRNSNELTEYAAGRAGMQPISVSECAATPASGGSQRRTTRKS